MNYPFLSIIHYNLKFIYKKIILLSGWIIALLLFHTLYYVGYADHYSALDIYLLSIGGVEVKQLHLIQMFIVLLPYLGIAVIVDVYIAQMMGRHAIYMITRMKKRTLFLKSHLVSLFFIIALMLLIYHCMIMAISLSLYSGSQINETLFPWIFMNKSILLFLIFTGQLLGTFCVTCVQLAISTKLNRFSSSFIVIAVIYFLQLIFSFILGQHTFIPNILTDYSSYIRFVLIQLLIMAGSILYLYFTSKKNILVFSERS